MLLLTGCTSIRPLVKIGLIAPFEGLYRASGYAALAGVRQAVADCTPPGMDVLPLALDDSGDSAHARRAAQKLLRDPSVRVVVGPFLLETIPAVAQVMTHREEPGNTPGWFVPVLIAPATGFVAPTSSAWLDAQIDHVAEATGARRVLLLGLPAAWEVSLHTEVETLRINDLDRALATLETGNVAAGNVAAGDAILWLGRPDTGAQWHDLLEQARPGIEFWLAAQAGVDIFAAHAQNRQEIYWLHWSTSKYNQRPQSTQQARAATEVEIQPTDAVGELAYDTACAALESLRANSPVTVDWELREQPVRSPTATNAR